MTRIKGFVMTTNLGFGWLRSSPFGMEVIGDLLVPSPIEVEMPSTDGEPTLDMLIEVIDGVPRCTELVLKRTEGGREIREKDLRAIEVDHWIESFVALVSAEVVPNGSGASGHFSSDADAVRRGVKTIRDVRKGSRRPMTADRRQRVADVYNAHETGGVEAVQTAFTVSRSTAIRYINAARDAGLIQKGAR
jgi:hypothetical protein